MAHEVESLAYVSNENLARTGVPWHGLGTPHATWLTDDEAKAALDWTVELRPIYWQTDTGINVRTTDSQATVKIGPNGKLLKAIATVGTYYQPFQNSEMIDLGSLLVNDYGAKWDTVASLRGDKIVFATLRLDVVDKKGRGLCSLDDSDYNSWLLLSSSHDGSMKLSCHRVHIRTVCANTLAAGLGSAHSGWTIRHTGDITEKAKIAHEQMKLITREDQAFAETAQKLAETKMELEEFDRMMEDVIPMPKDGDKAKRNAEATRLGCRNNWLNSKTISEEIRPTRWGAFQAVSEYSEWMRPTRENKAIPPAERRMLSVCFGGPAASIRDKAGAWLTRKAS
jgi:phage/plasmid-like protein (TIGR03299 family)